MRSNAVMWARRPALLAGLALLSGCVVYEVPPGAVVHAPPPAVRHEHVPPEPVTVLISARDRGVILDYFGTLHQRRDPVSRRIYERGVHALPDRQRRHIHAGRPLPAGIVRESLPRGLVRELSRLPVGFMWVRVGTDVMIVDARTGRVADMIRDGARITVVRGDGWSPEQGREWHDAHRGERGEWSEAEQERWHDGDHRDHRDDRADHRNHSIPDVYFGRDDRRTIAEYFVAFGGGLGRVARQSVRRQFANPPAHLRNRIREGDRLPAGVKAVPFPNDLNARLGRLPRGVVRMRIGTDVVLLHQPSGTVLDVIRDGATLEQPPRSRQEERRDAREERREDRQEAREERRDDRREAREDRQEVRQDRREDRQEVREDRRDERQEARADRRDDRREAREDRQETRQDRREDRQEARQDRREDRREAREDRQEARQDRREDRQEARQDRREDRQEVREDRRDERQEARADRRDDRREAREDRQEARQDRRDERQEAREDRRTARRDSGGGDGAVVAIGFSDRDREVIASYYASHRGQIKPLPPGMRNRLAQGKPLPRGIRSQALPQELERQLAPLPSGHRRVVVGTDMVILDAAGKVADLLKNFLR